MAQVRILYWQEIPSMVEAREGAEIAKAQLGDRFQKLIDAMAMRRGIAGTDGYLDEWHYGDPEARTGSPEAVLEAVVEEIESRFAAIKAQALEKG